MERHFRRRVTLYFNCYWTGKAAIVLDRKLKGHDCSSRRAAKSCGFRLEVSFTRATNGHEGYPRST
jgi:hypothetical protein